MLSVVDGSPHGMGRARVPLFDNLHLENSFEDNGVSGQQVLGLIPASRPAPSPTFSRLSLLFLAGASLTTSRLSGCASSCGRRIRLLESLTFELVTYVCLFEARFSLRVQHLRQRSPQVTVSFLSLLARVPSSALASVALCLAIARVRDCPFSLESTPSRIGSSAWFLSCVVWVSFLLSGAR